VFILMQVLGGAAALAMIRTLYPQPATVATDLAMPVITIGKAGHDRNPAPPGP
jgi:hypothetical protein